VIRPLALAVLLASWVAPVRADPCTDQFYHGVPPALQTGTTDGKLRTLCFDGFAVLHSGLSRTPLWSAEHLTADRIAAARALPRKDSFHAEANLSKDERAELADYAHSPYDRGHMAPDGDMADPASEHDSFSLANMIPQVPSVNRGIWAQLEGKVRGLATRDGEVYVVTGPIFAGSTLLQLHDRVLVPSGMFKAVYDPKQGWAGAYVVDNVEGATAREVTAQALFLIARIDPFPAVTVEADLGPLPVVNDTKAP
jgi:endonuclease G, mitochondrial